MSSRTLLPPLVVYFIAAFSPGARPTRSNYSHSFSVAWSLREHPNIHGSRKRQKVHGVLHSTQLHTRMDGSMFWRLWDSGVWVIDLRGRTLYYVVYMNE